MCQTYYSMTHEVVNSSVFWQYWTIQDCATHENIAWTGIDYAFDSNNLRTIIFNIVESTDKHGFTYNNKVFFSHNYANQLTDLSLI